MVVVLCCVWLLCFGAFICIISSTDFCRGIELQQYPQTMLSGIARLELILRDIYIVCPDAADAASKSQSSGPGIKSNEIIDKLRYLVVDLEAHNEINLMRITDLEKICDRRNLWVAQDMVCRFLLWGKILACMFGFGKL